MTKLLLKVSSGQKYSWTKIILLTVRGTFIPFNFQPRFYVDPATLNKIKPDRAATAAVTDVNVKKAI